MGKVSRVIENERNRINRRRISPLVTRAVRLRAGQMPKGKEDKMKNLNELTPTQRNLIDDILSNVINVLEYDQNLKEYSA
jgi:hypothetical protein